jgi:hypothetical protein
MYIYQITVEECKETGLKFITRKKYWKSEGKFGGWFRHQEGSLFGL